MWKVLVFVILVVLMDHVADATLCYQCDSWEHRSCGEEDTLDEQFLVPCSPYQSQLGQFQPTPQTCLKEVTYFQPGQIQGQLDPYNRYGRPHVLRHCGISLNQHANYQNNREDAYDRCFKTEVVVNGLRADRWICSCSDDACNSAFSSKPISLSTLIISIGGLLLSRMI